MRRYAPRCPVVTPEVNACVLDGKAALKAANEKIRTSFGKKPPPAELLDWRLEWTAGFDGAAAQIGENERGYFARQGQNQEKIKRAFSRLEIALE